MDAIIQKSPPISPFLIFMTLAVFALGGASVDVLASAAFEPSPFNVWSRSPHAAQMIDRGVAALEIRLQMIERARESIDLEYFIYNTDYSGRLVTQALIRKKQQNPSLKIRISLDASSTVLALEPEYASELNKYGIEVRYYNDVPMADVIASHYRNHRKNLIIDGNTPWGECLTGGRNIGDEYFDLNSEFNSIDRDLWIQGPVVRPMQQVFDAYWQDPVMSLPDEVEAEVTPEVRDFLTENANDRVIRADVERIGKQQLADPSSKGICNEVHYVSDQPGYVWGFNGSSFTRQVLGALLSRLDEVPSGGNVLVESPYFILKQRGSEALAQMLARGVTGTLLTNSLGSTDSYYVSAVFNAHIQALSALQGVTLYMYDGSAPSGVEFPKDQNGIELGRPAIWGIHAKTIVFDDRSFGIDTFNLDPRSANLNNELAVICENSPELARAIKNSFYSRIAQSYKIGRDGRPENPDISLLHGASALTVLKYLLSMVPANLFDFLL